MSYTRNGEATVVQQSTVTFSPSSYQTVIPIEGTRADIDALAAAYQASGISCTVTPLEGPSARLEATFIGAGGIGSETEAPIVTEWKFTTAGSVVPVEEHYDFVEALDAMKAAWAAGGQDVVDLGLRTLQAYIAGTDPDTLNAAALADIRLEANGMIRFVELILGGTKSFIRGDGVVQVQRRYQPTATYYPNLAVVGTVYSNASLVAGLDMPANVSSRLPTGEWLCEHVEFDYSSDGSRVETQSFHFARTWNTILYPDRA